MKNILRLLFVALVVAAVPHYAFADEEADVDANGTVSADTESDDTAVVEVDGSAKLPPRERLRDKEVEVVERNAEVLENRREVLEGRAQVLSNKSVEFNESEKKLREKYTELKSKLLENRAEIRGVEADFATSLALALKSGNENDINKSLEKAKELLNLQLDRVVKELELTRNSLEEAGSDENQDLLADIDEKLATIEELRAKISEITTLAELKELGNEIRDQWMSERESLRVTAARVILVRSDQAIDKMQAAIERIELKVADLEEEGYDVTGAQAAFESAKQKLESAKVQLDQIKVDLKEIDTSDKEAVKNGLDEAKDGVTQIRKELGDAAKELRMALQLLKQSVGNGSDVVPEEVNVSAEGNVSSDSTNVSTEVEE